MPFTVILDQPALAGRRVRRGLSATIGSVLIGVGVVAGIPAFLLFLAAMFLLLWLIVAFISQNGFPEGDLPGQIMLGLVVSLIVTFGASTAGVRLLRGKRHLMLFLRRFGHTSTTETITQASASIGATWRLVTLDDAQIAPVSVGRGARGFLRLGEMAGSARRRIEYFSEKAVGPLLGLAFAVMIVAGVIAFDEAENFGFIFDWSAEASSPAAIVFRVSAGLALSLLLGVMAYYAVMIVSTLLGAPLFALTSSVAASIREAEQNTGMAIADRQAIAVARDRIVQQSRRVFSARLFVITVDSSVWREAVTEFAAVSTVPLIDISDPSEHVVWEIEQLVRRFGRRCVVVGEYGRLGRMFDQPRPGSVEHQVQRLLDGHEVLGYTADRAGRQRFVRALRAKLEAHAAA